MEIEKNQKPQTEKSPITARHAAARCLVSVVDYYDAGETAEAAAVMSAGIREVITLCGDPGLTPSEFVTTVLYPPGKALANRYGSECGRQLFAAFLRAFLAMAETPYIMPPPLRSAIRLPS